jgi:hypothetical protein
MQARVLIVCILVVVAAGLFVADGVRLLRMTDAEIEAGAPEDTLGFGIFFPMLVLFGVPSCIAVLWLWRQVGRSKSRPVAGALTALLVLSILFSVWAYDIFRARVLK